MKTAFVRMGRVGRTCFATVGSRRSGVRIGRSLALAAMLVAGAAAGAQAAVVEDFESYTVGASPLPPWEVIRALPESPVVKNDANSISGNYLQLSSLWDSSTFVDTIGLALSVPLSQDGDYLQVAINIDSGNTLASLFIHDTPYPGGLVPPRAAVGLDTHNNQFNYNYDSVYKTERFGSASAGTWYYFRATMRDNEGVPGLIDSYDFQVFSDAAGTNLVAEELGISFADGYEGSLAYIALSSYEQTGTATAYVLYDEITANVVPEPSSLAAVATASILGLIRRRRTA